MRYRVSDLPVKGAGAFCPVPMLNPEASSHGLVRLYGAPGTEPQPTPKPQNDWLPSQTITGGIDSAQGGNVAPDYLLWDDYTPFATNMGPAADAHLGMRRRRFNELPVPARDPIRLALPTQGTASVGGRGQIPWPRAFQRWPSKSAT